MYLPPTLLVLEKDAPGLIICAVEPFGCVNNTPKNIIAIPVIDVKKGLDAFFQCTKRKINETNGKNRQLRPHIMLVRNVAIR